MTQWFQLTDSWEKIPQAQGWNLVQAIPAGHSIHLNTLKDEHESLHGALWL